MFANGEVAANEAFLGKAVSVTGPLASLAANPLHGGYRGYANLGRKEATPINGSIVIACGDACVAPASFSLAKLSINAKSPLRGNGPA